ncbi:unnamed protein product [Hyaloperonospora brassicae]|uniref:DUF2423 domain-containing protein n=1 Tax=Hyaloperonospora brassicae TaxID=162125 RepID=A0AAV0UAW0_HYABA|nr:unnamed protein product [Hyaloperonospora brassicae]
MAKSLRSKIKRKFRTELRKRIGVPHEAIREAKIQENLKNAIAAQGTGASVASLKKLMGTPVPMSSSVITGVVKESTPEETAAALDEETDVPMTDVKKDKKDRKRKRKPKFVHFHQLRKKGV